MKLEQLEEIKKCITHLSKSSSKKINLINESLLISDKARDRYFLSKTNRC